MGAAEAFDEGEGSRVGEALVLLPLVPPVVVDVPVEPVVPDGVVELEPPW